MHWLAGWRRTVSISPLEESCPACAIQLDDLGKATCSIAGKRQSLHRDTFAPSSRVADFVSAVPSPSAVTMESVTCGSSCHQRCSIFSPTLLGVSTPVHRRCSIEYRPAHHLASYQCHSHGIRAPCSTKLLLYCDAKYSRMPAYVDGLMSELSVTLAKYPWGYALKNASEGSNLVYTRSVTAYISHIVGRSYVV